MSQEDGALSTDVKEEPTEKIRSKYVHPSPEKNEITPLNKEESNKDNNKSYQNVYLLKYFVHKTLEHF